MKKMIAGILLGTLAGIIDVIPMILQKLPMSANLSAFVMWVVVGFLLSVMEFRANPVLKGIFIAYLVLAPSAIIIGCQEPGSLMPVCLMTLILGGGLGYLVDKFAK